jgi:hypothetical protein
MSSAGSVDPEPGVAAHDGGRDWGSWRVLRSPHGPKNDHCDRRSGVKMVAFAVSRGCFEPELMTAFGAKVLGPEENHGGESRNPEPRRIRARRQDRMPRRRGRGDGGVGVGGTRRPAPSDDSDAIEVDPEDEET